jgi:hypothetical protein
MVGGAFVKNEAGGNSFTIATLYAFVFKFTAASIDILKPQGSE